MRCWRTRTAYETQTEQGTALRFYWNTVQDLDRNNADFQTAVQQFGITEEQIDGIFAKIKAGDGD